MKYILKDKAVVPCKDVIQWAAWFEKADRRVAKEFVNGCEISTVF